MFAAATEPAESFDCRRRFAALWTKRLIQRHETRPAFRACPSPTALPYWSVTYDARDWEQEIENVVEQSAFGETQGQNQYSSIALSRYFEYGKLLMIDSARYS